MWSEHYGKFSDEFSARVAEFLYRTILTLEHQVDVRKAASALHFAIRKLREESGDGKGISDLMAWTPYIHVGV